jgi:hypothetical protein
MSLMIGTGPFGQAPAGVFNAEMPREALLCFKLSPRRPPRLAGNRQLLRQSSPHSAPSTR